MAEYIEKEALRGWTLIPPPTPSGKLIPVSVDDIPAADVRENVRGEWETDPEDLEWGNSLKKKRCPRCKRRPPYDWQNHRFILSDFCPNCGADMRGGDNGKQ